MARRKTKLKKAAKVIDLAARRENGAAERELRARAKEHLKRNVIELLVHQGLHECERAACRKRHERIEQLAGTMCGGIDIDLLSDALELAEKIGPGVSPQQSDAAVARFYRDAMRQEILPR